MIAPPVSAQKPPTGLQLGDLLAHGLDDAPAAEHRAQADRDVAAPDHPGRRQRVAGAGVAGGDQQHPDDADGLLRVVAAVAQAVQRRPRPAAAGGTSCPPAAARRAGTARPPATISSEPSRKPSSGETKMNSTVLQHAARRSARRRRPWRSTAPTMPPISACDELDGNAVPPGDDVPGDGADQRAEHHVVVDDARLRRCPCRPWPPP